MDTGVFDTGTEPVLWRPDLDRGRLRRRGVLESIVVEPLPFALIGVAIGLLAGGWTGLAITVATLVLSWWWSVSAYRCWGLDCSRPGYTRHRRDRGAGEWFYRPTDFHALPPDNRVLVERIFAALPAFDDDAFAWLDREHRAGAHQLGWELLEGLHHTLPARAVLARVSADLACDHDVQAVRHQLVLLDREIADAVDAFVETATLVGDLGRRLTRQSRLAALHEGLHHLRLPAAPVGMAALREEIRCHARAVDDVLDLAGSRS